MKNILLTLTLVFSYALSSAQNYVLDPTFGNGGVKINAGINFEPLNVLLINNSYYFFSRTKICKINYDGSIDLTFAQGGFFTLPNNMNLSRHQFVYSNGYIYAYSNHSSHPISNPKTYIIKLSLDGQLVSSFGDNGVKTITETGLLIKKVLVKDNTLFCAGTKMNKMVLFKLNLANGALNTSFATAGYKEYLPPNYDISVCNGILSYDNDFLLCAETEEGTMMMIKVNEQGNPVTTFGTSGIKYFNFESSTRGIENMQLHNEKIYCTWFGAILNFSFGGYLIHDLNSGQTTNFNSYYNTYIQPTDEGIYLTGGWICTTSWPQQCGPDYVFTLKRLLDNGVQDPSFMNGNIYTYNFPYTISSNAAAYVLLKDPSGKIILAGFNRAKIAGNPYPIEQNGFTFIRLMEQPALGIEDIIKNKAVIYPNPFSEVLNIKTGGAIKQIEMFDLAGRRLSTPDFKRETNGVSINTSSITTTGTYILKITADDGSQTIEKVIKQ